MAQCLDGVDGGAVIDFDTAVDFLHGQPLFTQLFDAIQGSVIGAEGLFKGIQGGLLCWCQPWRFSQCLQGHHGVLIQGYHGGVVIRVIA